MTTTAVTIYSIGHGRHPFDYFLELLKRHGINFVCDVRSAARSRWPQFNGAALSNALRVSGIGYEHLPECGGKVVAPPAELARGLDRMRAWLKGPDWRPGGLRIVITLLGIGLGFWLVGSSGSSTHQVWAASVSVGLLLFGAAIFVLVQRRGLFTGFLGALRRLGIRISYLEAREEKLRSLDRTILAFYTHDRRGFYLSSGIFFFGWLAEALEVYAILYYLGGPADPLSAIAIGALSVFIKGGTFFIPGSLGAQDGGNLLLLLAFGYSELTGIAFALLRRVRELVWIGIGLLCLAVMGGRNGRASVGDGKEH